MPRPTIDIRITGRRPKRSDNAPCTGPMTSCIVAKMTIMAPYTVDICAIAPPVRDFSNAGTTGPTMDPARVSSSTVIRMKAIAASPVDVATPVV